MARRSFSFIIAFDLYGGRSSRLKLMICFILIKKYSKSGNNMVITMYASAGADRLCQLSRSRIFEVRWSRLAPQIRHVAGDRFRSRKKVTSPGRRLRTRARFPRTKWSLNYVRVNIQDRLGLLVCYWPCNSSSGSFSSNRQCLFCVFRRASFQVLAHRSTKIPSKVCS